MTEFSLETSFIFVYESINGFGMNPGLRLTPGQTGQTGQAKPVGQAGPVGRVGRGRRAGRAAQTYHEDIVCIQNRTICS